jgi:hypothetical protein
LKTKQAIVVFSTHFQYNGEMHPEIMDLMSSGYQIRDITSTFYPHTEQFPEPIYFNSVMMERDEVA